TVERPGLSLRLPILTQTFTIGRGTANDLCIPRDDAISRQHCVVHVVGSSLILEDTSRNGTFVDGRRVVGIALLPIRATISIGHTRLVVRPTETQHHSPTILATALDPSDPT